ncbi:MAG: VOC family protein [bacterium]
MPEMDYGLVDAQDGSIGGGIGSAPGGAPPHAIFYVEVEDVQTSLDKAVELGARVSRNLRFTVSVGILPEMTTGNDRNFGNARFFTEKAGVLA